MTAVEVTYLKPGGVYRRRVCKLLDRWPIYLLNERDKQAHIVKGDEIFPMVSPIRLDTWEDLINEEPPDPAPEITMRQMVCEDNSMWPHAATPSPDPRMRSRDRRNALQEARQSAWIDASIARKGIHWVNQLGVMTGVVIAGAAGLLIIAIVWAQVYGG